MKSISKYILLSLLAVIGFTACSSDDDYEPGTASGEQVYFSNSLGSTLEISPSATSVTIPVERINTSGAITVPITVTGAEGSIYTFPSSVNFADGASEANLVVTYDPSKIEYGNYTDITISLGDDYSTPYGLAKYSFQIGVTAWGDWQAYNSAGTATYYYSQFWSGTDEGLPFQYRHNIIETNKYQFAISNVMYGVTFTIDYDSSTGHVTADPQFTGYTHSSYGDVYVCDYNYYWTTVRGQDLSESQKMYGTFDEEQGIFQIPLVYYVSAGYFGSGYEQLYIDGIVRADYTTAATYLGKLTNEAGDPTSVYFNVTLGSDVESANVAVVAGTEVDSTTMAAIIDGSYTPLKQITASGDVGLPAQDFEDGQYTCVVVPFGNGEAQTANTTTITFNYTKGASDWQSLGEAQFTDDFVGGLYFENYTPETWNVEIQESAKTPGLYRLVNPYTSTVCPFSSYGTYDTANKTYIEINATDPDGVYITAQSTGLTLSTDDGVIGIESMGAYYMDDGYTLDQVKENGLTGTLKDGVITFPARGLLALLGEHAYYANDNAGTKIVLPTASAAKKKFAKANKHLQKKALNGNAVNKMMRAPRLRR